MSVDVAGDYEAVQKAVAQVFISLVDEYRERKCGVIVCETAI